MESKHTYANGGLGIGMILFLIFLVLKLTGNIGWSWVWVAAPLWIPLGIAVVCLILAAILGAVATRRAWKSQCR